MSQQITNQDPGHWPSVNAAVAPLVERLVDSAAGLRIGVGKGPRAALSWIAASSIAAGWKQGCW